MAKKTLKPVADLSNFNLGEHIKEQRETTDNSAKKEKKPSTVKVDAKTKTKTKDTDSSNLPELPRNFQDRFFDNIFSFDRSPERGRPVYISDKLLNRLQALSERHYKRLTMRTLVQSVLATFLSYDTDKSIDEFLDKINFQVPTQEVLDARKTAAEKAKQRRAAGTK